MAITPRAFIGAGVVAAALVLLVFECLDDESPLDYFASHWHASAFMSHTRCDCALSPDGQCFQGDWDAMRLNGTAIGLLHHNDTSMALSKQYVCTGTPALVLGCVRPDQLGGTKPHTLRPPTRADRRGINEAFIELFDATLDGCEGDFHDVSSVAASAGTAHSVTYSPPVPSDGGLEQAPSHGSGTYNQHHRSTHRTELERMLRRRSALRQQRMLGLVDGAVPEPRDTRHVSLYWEAPRGHLRPNAGLDALAGLLRRRTKQQDDNAADEGGDTTSQATQRALDIVPIDSFLDDFADWDARQPPLSMSISGPGWRRCMRRFVWRLQKKFVCPIGTCVVCLRLRDDSPWRILDGPPHPRFHAQATTLCIGATGFRLFTCTRGAHRQTLPIRPLRSTPASLFCKVPARLRGQWRPTMTPRRSL